MGSPLGTVLNFFKNSTVLHFLHTHYEKKCHILPVTLSNKWMLEERTLRNTKTKYSLTGKWLRTEEQNEKCMYSHKVIKCCKVEVHSKKEWVDSQIVLRSNWEKLESRNLIFCGFDMNYWTFTKKHETNIIELIDFIIINRLRFLVLLAWVPPRWPLLCCTWSG